MKCSLIISVLIFIVAAGIGLPRLFRLQAIKSDYHKLEDYAQDLGISTNSPPLTHSDRSPATNKEATSPEKVTSFTILNIDHLSQNGTADEQNEIIAELIPHA
ncbi:MAG: hypothetical protein ACJAQT_003065 [Akkermansiaceae bacterium]|jgi:hypothetical protein